MKVIKLLGAASLNGMHVEAGNLIELEDTMADEIVQVGGAEYAEDPRKKADEGAESTTTEPAEAAKKSTKVKVTETV